MLASQRCLVNGGAVGGGGPTALGTPVVTTSGSFGPGGTGWGVAAGAAVPRGNTLVAVGQVNTADLSGLGDSSSNAWSVLAKTAYQTGQSPYVGFIGSANVTTALTATTNVNFSFTNGGSGSGSTYFETTIITFTGTSTVNGTPQATSGTTVTTLSLTQTGIPAGGLAIACLGLDSGGGAVTWPAGWVSLGTANYLPVAYQAFPSGGTADATPTWVTAATAELMLAVFT